MEQSKMQTAENHVFHANILREYDIRGVVGETLTETDCYFVGRCFGTIVKRKGGTRIVVGYDGRESSIPFSNALHQGITDCGVDVTDIGLGPTPMVYFAMQDGRADASVMITGSHSPLAYNGIKMALKDGPFYSDDIQDIGKMALAGDFETGAAKVDTQEIKQDYVERLLKDYEAVRDLKVVWDNGNGAGGEILRMLTAKLPGEHILLFDEIDGTFPNHHPDPTIAKNLVDLQNKVKETGADLGIGFDGDADRIGAVDADGEIVWADMLMAAYTKEVLKTNPGATIVGDVKCSRVMFDEIKALGGVPVMWNTGHSIIKAKMKETKSPLGGELAGHICFADKYYGFDDALYCGVRLLNLVASSDKGLAGLVDHLPTMYYTPEVRFEVDEDRKFDITPEIKARLIADDAADTDICDIDGVRVTTPDGWWLIRASNTEPVLTVRAEGFDEQGLEKLKTSVVEQLGLSGVEFSF